MGRRGSGTIFFSNCNLLCCFCQNWEINHRGDGSFASDEAIVNLVTPTHCVWRTSCKGCSRPSGEGSAFR